MRGRAIVVAIITITLAAHSAALLHARQTPEGVRQEIRALYNFSPHDLTDAQITAKSKSLDEFWSKAKANRDTYIPVLREELAKFSNPPFFRYDGAKLLVNLSPGVYTDRRIAQAAMSHCDLRDVNRTDYLRTMHDFRVRGDEVTEGAFLLLSDPQFQVFIPQHSLTLDQADALLYLLLPMHPVVWVDEAVKRLQSEKDAVNQRSLLTALWYAQTPDADRAIASLETSSSVSDEVKTFARELLKRNVDVPASGETAQLPTEGAIRSARVDAMKDISDEAIGEVQRLTRQLVLRRRSPEPDSSVSQTSVEAAIFRALMRDFAVPGRERYRKQTPPSVITVDPENLGACPTNPAEIVHGCVSTDILESARLEAARGSWSFDLVSDLENRTKDPLTISRLDVSAFERIIVVQRAELNQVFPRPTRYAMSRPAIRGKSALAVVQFAQLSTWLVLLEDDGTGWKVTKTIANGMS